MTIPPLSNPSAPKATSTSSPFPLGVMSGEITPQSAVLWTHHVAAAPLQLTVRDAATKAVVRAGPVEQGPDGYTHVQVDGLKPGTLFEYTFASDTGSASGQFRSAVAPESEQVVTFGATSCTDRSHAPFPVLSGAADQPLDFFIHCGDNVYADGAKTREEYRAKYAEVWPTQGKAELHQATGAYGTVDDHEFFNNMDPETVPPARFQAALEAFFEHMPLARCEEDPQRIWRSFKWGQAAEVFMLDSRTERKPSTRTTPDAQYLSPEQLTWLKEGLKSSDSVFKFVINSVPIGDFPLVFDVEARDRWEGYAAQRRELLDFVHQADLTGVWFISGDFHLGAAGRVGPPGSSDHALPEVLVGPAGNSGNPLRHAVRGRQWDFVTGANTYTVFRADPVARELEVAFMDAQGRALYRARYDESGMRIPGPGSLDWEHP